MEKIIDGVRVFFEEGTWNCDIEDYRKAKNDYSEENFCNWCDKHNLIDVG
jgi:hypothetical protein